MPNANVYDSGFLATPTLSGAGATHPLPPLTSDAPATYYAPCTPDDATDLAQPSRAVVIGTAGDLCVVRLDGVTVTLPHLPAGIHPIVAVRIKATGTTATDLSIYA